MSNPEFRDHWADWSQDFPPSPYISPWPVLIPAFLIIAAGLVLAFG